MTTCILVIVDNHIEVQLRCYNHDVYYMPQIAVAPMPIAGYILVAVYFFTLQNPLMINLRFAKPPLRLLPH